MACGAESFTSATSPANAIAKWCMARYAPNDWRSMPPADRACRGSKSRSRVLAARAECGNFSSHLVSPTPRFYALELTTGLREGEILGLRCAQDETAPGVDLK